MYGVVTEASRPTDTAGDLLGRLAVSGAALLAATLDGIADDTLRPQPQPADGISHAPKVTVADARVDWAAPAAAVDRLVRSVTPDPGRVDDVPHRAPGPRPGAPPTRARPGAQAGGAARREATGAGGHGHRARGARGGAAGRAATDAAPDWARGVRTAAGEVLT